MTYRRLLFIFVISCKLSVNSRVVIYLFIVIHRLRRLQPRLFLRHKFSFRKYTVRKTAAENRRQKMESIYGAGFCSVCHGYYKVLMTATSDQSCGNAQET